MKSDNPHLNYAFLDPEFFETFDNYKPARELTDPVRSMCGDGWAVTPRGYWCHCNPGAPIGNQGWKIHVSATPMTALSLLQRIVPACVAHRIPFKFLSDLRMVRLSLSKSCSRELGGKFITVYPPDQHTFVHFIQRCDEATRGFVGPFIISDYPYGDSKVVFYRYGEHMHIKRVDASGRAVHAIVRPDGAIVADERAPLRAVPEWLEDPLGVPKSTGRALTEWWLRDRRYRITGARRYSNFGGIYKASDTETGRAVIIREARPHLGDSSDPQAAQNILRKQARIMCTLRDTGLVPDLIELFEEQGHLFLVEEMLQGDTLWGYTMGWGHFAPQVDSRGADTILYHTTRDLIEGLLQVHKHRIVLRDLTKSNVFVTPERRVKFFDFEFSFELDRAEPPMHGGTHGYMSPEQQKSAPPTVAEDYYALGALIVDMITFSASGLSINRAGIIDALRQALRDMGLPAGYADAVAGLTAPATLDRIHPIAALRLIESSPRFWKLAQSADSFVPPPFDAGGPNDDVHLPHRDIPSDAEIRIKSTIEGITSYILSSFRPLSEDRLWPTSPEMFVTNPINLAFGASGIVSYLNRVGCAIPDGAVQWIIRKATPDVCPSGLYIGLSGVAVCLLQIGLVEQAKRILALSNDRERVLEIPGLYHGAAGWALANLVFWDATGERMYLEYAQEVAWHLLQIAKHSAQGSYWEHNGEVGFGLGFGASGIATLFMFLNAVSPEPRLLEAASQALDYEMANARWAFGHIVWPDMRTDSTKVPLTPHTRFGTSGIGTAAIRMYAVTGEPRFRRLAELCAFTASIRLGNKLWQDFGLCGQGELLLDMFKYLGDETFRNNAFYVSEAILRHAISKPEGIAFAGVDLLRISCDFAVGSAGIGWFLHRLLNPERSRLLLPDHLLESCATGHASVRACANPAQGVALH